MICLKRAYDPPAAKDGARILVDRLWPRGCKKADLKLTAWLKDAAPSSELRRWFGHDPEKWPEFQRRYRAELKALLKAHPEALRPLLAAARQGTLTLLYAAHDPAHNNAVVLKSYLENQCRRA